VTRRRREKKIQGEKKTDRLMRTMTVILTHTHTFCKCIPKI